MQEKGKISAWQAVFICLFTPLGTGIFILPAFEISWAREDAWLIQILATIPALVVVFLVNKLGRMFPGQTIVQYSETILGKYFGKLIGFLFSVYFFWTGSIILFELGSFLDSAVMPETPLLVFLSITGLVIAYTTYMGLETVGRLNIWFFPIVAFSIVIISLLALKDMNLDHFRPFLANGLWPILRGGLTPIFFRGAISAMTMLFPYVNQPESIKKPFIYSVFILGLVFEINTVTTLAVLGPFEGGRITFPTVHMVKIINVADFIQHIEIVLILTWIGASFIQCTGWFYFSVLATAQVFDLKSYRPLIIPMMLVYTFIAMFNYRSYPKFVSYVDSVWMPYGAVHIFLIPIFLLVVAIVRGLGVGKQGLLKGGSQQ